MTAKEQRFIDTVWDFYRAEGRHQLPWRQTTDPYRILVSEIMLQQTQVDRVLSKYEVFITRWPTVQALARASLGEVLRAWQGLGYNRRAKSLLACAQQVMNEQNGVFPQTAEALQKLPGIGPYTAGAIMAFAYNQPVPIIETNIRTVYLHHFFAKQREVDDAAIEKRIAATLDQTNPREWYWALMDYGAHIKKTHGNLNRASASYSKQSKFKGSDREIRGAILKALADQAHTKRGLVQALGHLATKRVEAQCAALEQEGLIVWVKRRWQLPD